MSNKHERYSPGVGLWLSVWNHNSILSLFKKCAIEHFNNKADMNTQSEVTCQRRSVMQQGNVQSTGDQLLCTGQVLQG